MRFIYAKDRKDMKPLHTTEYMLLNMDSVKYIAPSMYAGFFYMSFGNSKQDATYALYKGHDDPIDSIHELYLYLLGASK